MRFSMQKLTAWSLAAAFAAISLAAVASPFLGSRSDPHATLYLNVDQRAKQIYPVSMFMVDGKLSNRGDQGMLWVTPGDYTFTFRVARDARLTANKPGEIGTSDAERGVNMSDAPGLERDSGSKNDQPHELKISLEAGKAYYIGAKLGAKGAWEPVVWKTEDETH